MPRSKNKRKNKSAQTRKVNRNKAVNREKINTVELGNSPSMQENPERFSPEQNKIQEATIPGFQNYGFSPRWNNEPEYKVDIFFDDDESLDQDQSVHFEMTEAHYRSTEIGKVDFMAEIGGGDIMGPDVASVSIDPRDKIIGHPRWTTGEDAIRELDQDPNVFRGEFDGNRWQGRGSDWAECPPDRADCWDRQGITSCENPPVCSQCQEETKPAETHYHILEHNEPGRLCQICWAKSPLPPEDQAERIEFTR